MELWHINLLGIPRVVRDGQETRLRARESWATLAALLIPTKFGKRTYALSPHPQSRQALADYFWGDKPDPRVHLRQSLAALRNGFGAECFVADRERVQVAAGRFVTDVEQMLLAYRRAADAETAEERLHCYADAAGYLGGDFLEGCFEPGDWGEGWVLQRRAEMRGVIVQILTDYREALVEAERLPAALEIACRVLEWQPDHQEARKRARELASKTGQIMIYQSLGTEEDFRTVMERLRVKPQNSLTLSERKLFSVLFQSELTALGKYRKPFLRLSVFPAPFSLETAQTVCRVSTGVLRVLAKTPLLEYREEKFTIPEVARLAAWRQVPTATRRQLQKRIAGLCEVWVYNATANPPAVQPPFAAVAEAYPFLQIALQWQLQQPPTGWRIDMLNRLRILSVPDLVYTALPYLEHAYSHSTLPIGERCFAAWCGGHIRLDRGDFQGAIFLFEQALVSLAAEPHTFLAANLNFYLSLAHHHSRDAQAAHTHILQAIEHYTAISHREGVGQCLRFLCEIQNHCGDYESALIACEEALQIRREIRPRWDSVADALYWKGMTLWNLGRLREAADSFEEALSLWQETEDTTGIAFCLRMMGRTCTKEGRFAEARAHIEHAILLHERKGDQGSRIAAIAALADNYFEEGRFSEAQRLYTECLENSEAKQTTDRSDSFRAKIAACSL